MELENASIIELIDLYSKTIKELKKRQILRTNNVVGEIGEFFVIEKYSSNKSLPTLTALPVGTKNINAVDKNGARYSIKSTTGTNTSVIYGLEPPESSKIDNPIFEYIVICKLSDNYELEGIYQLDWAGFIKHKKWHSRMKAWSLSLTESLRQDSTIIFERITKDKKMPKQISLREDSLIKESDPKKSKTKLSAVSWNETGKINHQKIHEMTVECLSHIKNIRFIQESISRYVSEDRKKALFVMSAKYSEKNKEYWYSIGDETLPWMGLFDECYIAFAMGSSSHVLVFTYEKIKEMLNCCLRTKEDASKGKKAHYHIAFAVEGKKHIYFKKKLPSREYIDVTDFLMEA